MTVLLTGCKSGEEAIVRAKVNKKDLLEESERASIQYDYLSYKTTVHAMLGDEKKSFKAVVRMRKDSAIWFSLKPTVGGIEVARIIVTPDSAKMIDRLNKKYFAGDLRLLEQKLDVELSFEVLQKLITAGALETMKDKPKVSYNRSENQYLVSAFKDRNRDKRLEKIENKGKEGENMVFHSTWIDGANLQVVKLSIRDITAKRSLVAQYDDYEKLEEGGHWFPEKMRFSVQGGEEISVECSISKVNPVKKLSFPFSVPDKYEHTVY